MGEYKAALSLKDGQGVSAVARELGMSEQTLRNWIKAAEAGKLSDDRLNAPHPYLHSRQNGRRP